MNQSEPRRPESVLIYGLNVSKQFVDTKMELCQVRNNYIDTPL